ncbi:MAG: 2-succinyl-5-enolpyruvyl-6-hydroxy-3-cyclohexene-1-carboxylic-acid synthase [Muribaculaceae bacterium]|nr:2-succinyl-5-enolpyruvyl-6-hydroxy-3-cyclohexene-1-carboxylic-acid synthase [Muribaculaceae bacterium]
MKDTDNTFCRILLDVLEAQGVRDVVASPGSRNAPLLISCSYRENLNTRVVTDERMAGFIALGMASVSRRPVVLMCTSGTALYNYAPAVAEAYYQGIPLIIISADRPFHWIDQQDSQTLSQPGALSKIVKKSFDIPVNSDAKEMEWYVNRTANEAFILASDNKPGPVHINLQIEAPLSNTADSTPVLSRVIRIMDSAPALSQKDIGMLLDSLIGKKILVVAGYMAPDNSLNKYISLFSSLPGVVTLCETLSNIHLKGNPYAIDSVISGLSPEVKSKLKPDLVISIGGALVSRMLKEYLREETPEIWTLGDTYYGIDVFKNLSLNIKTEPAYFFKVLYYALRRYYRKNAETLDVLKEYAQRWNKVRSMQLDARRRFVDQAKWSELKAFQRILNTIPRSHNLFLSNGTPVRYAQLFTENIPHASYSNRGVSGIEGTNATAVGCALAYKDPTLLITGDMSFAYAPGIMGLEFLPPSFKIIIINNKGGGIFRFISPTRYIEHRDKFFCADPKIPVKDLAATYGWVYMSAKSDEELEKHLTDFFACKKNVILEIIVEDEEYSASLLRKYMRIDATSSSFRHS